MDNEKKNLKKKKTTRKSTKRDTIRTDVINVEKSNSLPVIRRYVQWFREYAYNEDNLTLGMFFKQFDVPKTAFYAMLEKFPEVKPDFYDALDIIGARREEGALKNKLNAAFVAQSQARYCRETKALAKEFIDYKAQANAKHQLQMNIPIPQLITARESDLVPQREHKNNS